MKPRMLCQESQLECLDFVILFGKDLAFKLDFLADSIRKELEIEENIDEFRQQTANDNHARSSIS